MLRDDIVRVLLDGLDLPADAPKTSAEQASLRDALASVTTEEYRVGYSRVDQRHGRNITYRECADLETAEFIASMERRKDAEGIDGRPVANRLTVLPFIEVRTVTTWCSAPGPKQEPGS